MRTTILFMAEHRGLCMKLERKPKMLTESMPPAHSVQSRAKGQASGPRPRHGAIGVRPVRGA